MLSVERKGVQIVQFYSLIRVNLSTVHPLSCSILHRIQNTKYRTQNIHTNHNVNLHVNVECGTR